jgi:5-methylcytosine-specific restriction protein A
MVEPFLLQKGFTAVDDRRVLYGQNESQIVEATSPAGVPMTMHVQLCWRRDGRSPHERRYAAAQLLAKVTNDEWESTIQAKVDRDLKHGVTHALFIQREAASIVYAALVPMRSLLAIWLQQRDISRQLIDSGRLGRRKTKNHAMNGSSPTLWLQDDRTPDAHAVAAALWQHVGVEDLAKLYDHSEGPALEDDSFDDCPAVYAQLGSDGAQRVRVMRSHVRRDPRVRAEVMKRAAGTCERASCRESRSFAGFLDVHHILGAEKSDRVWNCVGLCPNCHREAHFAPDQDAINAELLAFASTFVPLAPPADAAAAPA